MNPDTHRVLIINEKGGCGKTTIATNLAAAYAKQGKSVALVDNDSQASSSYWGEKRDASMPQVHIVRAHQRASMYETQAFHNRMPANVNCIVIDGHSGTRDHGLESVIRQSDVILIPLLPSAIDIRAGSRFMTNLLTHRLLRDSPRPVGVIANRVHPEAEIHAELHHFLSCLDIPIVATFHDSGVYTDAVGLGQGVIDMTDRGAARKETPAWHKLITWIDSHPHNAVTTAGALRGRPQAVTRPVGKQPLRA